MMDETEADRVRALGEILQEFDLDALRVKIGDVELELVRREPASAAPMVYAAPNLGVALPPSAPHAASSEAPGNLPASSAGAAPGPNVRRVTAPVVGVFYRASAPGADPFVEPGQRVAAGQVLCILEAMKLMNEITAEVAGTVVRVVPENGELVTVGSDLFWIEP